MKDQVGVRRGATAALFTRDDLVYKMPLSPADNDLMRREATSLRAIARDGDPTKLPYVPRLVETFRHTQDVEREVNVISRAPDGFVTLDEIAAARPGGLDARDVAWIWRRLLVAIGLAHQAGIVHGAVFGQHVLVHPIDHGLILVDWTQSVPLGRPLTALVARYRDEYPPGVLMREPATGATDVYLATRCVDRLLGDPAPAQIAIFIRGCLLRPPHDAWRLLGELDELLDDLYGPRTYRPFHI